MPIIDQKAWKAWEDNNTDPYGKCCIDVARYAMEILDERDGTAIGDPDALISDAEKRLPQKEQGISGFMAGAVAVMISRCHSRGEEFRKIWNLSIQIGTEGEMANESGTVLNPSILTFA